MRRAAGVLLVVALVGCGGASFEGAQLDALDVDGAQLDAGSSVSDVRDSGSAGDGAQHGDGGDLDAGDVDAVQLVDAPADVVHVVDALDLDAGDGARLDAAADVAQLVDAPADVVHVVDAPHEAPPVDAGPWWACTYSSQCTGSVPYLCTCTGAGCPFSPANHGACSLYFGSLLCCATP